MTDPKAKAQEIVDNYFNILFDDGDVNEIAICKHYAIACAISEVEGRIETLVEFNKIIPISIKAAVEQLDAVLTELKNMNQ
jgi:uncharacterized membrane protein